MSEVEMTISISWLRRCFVMQCCQCVGGQHTMSHDFGETKLFQRRRSMKKRLSIFLVTVALIAGMVGCAPPPVEIWDWYDLDAVRENLGGSYLLMNDLDADSVGYMELASPTANQGNGWQPIGSFFADPIAAHPIIDPVAPFSGSFDGQGYEIRDLFVDRPDQHGVGLFGSVDEGGVVENLRVVNAEVTGDDDVGGLVGGNDGGTVSNSYFAGSVTGDDGVGGLWEAGSIAL